MSVLVLVLVLDSVAWLAAMGKLDGLINLIVEFLIFFLSQENLYEDDRSPHTVAVPKAYLRPIKLNEENIQAWIEGRKETEEACNEIMAQYGFPPIHTPIDVNRLYARNAYLEKISHEEPPAPKSAIIMFLEKCRR